MKQATKAEPELVSRIRAMLAGPERHRAEDVRRHLLHAERQHGRRHAARRASGAGGQGRQRRRPRPTAHPHDGDEPAGAAATSWSGTREPDATAISGHGWTLRWRTSRRCRRRKRRRRRKRPRTPRRVEAEIDLPVNPYGNHCCHPLRKQRIDRRCHSEGVETIDNDPPVKPEDDKVVFIGLRTPSSPTPRTPPAGPWRRSARRRGQGLRRPCRRARRGGPSPSSSPRWRG